MSENERFDEIGWDKDAESKLFNEILAVNKHIQPAQYALLRAWARIQLKIEKMGPTRELLRFCQESRLLGSALKLMPTKKEDVTTDLTSMIQEVLDEQG